MDWMNKSKNIPKENTSYIIYLNQSAAIRIGLGGLPPMVIARFKNGEWSLNGGLIPTPVTDNDVMHWHEIPPEPK